MSVARWWLVRHAPAAELPGRIHGRLDVAADLSGAAALDALAARLPARALWVASHLRRARETAAALAARMAPAPPAPEIEPDLSEQGFGAWEGLTHDEVSARDAVAAERFWADPARARPPGGESFAEVVARVAPALDRLSAGLAGADVVAVCHAGAIRAALAAALGLAPDRALAFAVDPVSLTRLDRIEIPDGPAVWRVVSVNWTAA